MGTFPTKFTKITWKLWLFQLLLCSAQAGWSDPPIEEIENGLEGITILASNKISIRENVGRELNGPFSIVKFRLTSSDETVLKTDGDGRFSAVFNGGWFLNVSGYLDYEELEDKSPVILFHTENEFQIRNFMIQVEDENDNAPRIIKMTPDPVPPIKEQELINKPILIIEAVDDDVADTIEFSLLEDNQDPEHFRITQDGEVYMTKSLNYTSSKAHDLSITITDCCREPRHMTNVHVNVFVQETPPNLPPVFVASAFEEHLEIDTVVTRVQALDGDYSMNWDIEYEMEDDDLFKIDRVTGEIKVKSDIDAESPRFRNGLTHQVKVIAVEKHPEDFDDPNFEPMTQSKNLTLGIIDIDDNPPRLCGVNEFECCRESESFYTFTINTTHLGYIPMDNGREIRVNDIDRTKAHNTFSVDYAPGTIDVIRRAFTIIPSRGSKGEKISIAILPSFDWTDLENEKLDGFWNEELTFTIEITGTNNARHKAYVRIKAKVIDVNN